MIGKNRYYQTIDERKSRSEAQPCAFISYRHSDVDAVKEVERFLTHGVGIDVYIDYHDSALSAAASSGDDGKVVEFIEAALDASTHLLGVLSARTSGSWWVPFEIGSARGRGNGLAHLVLDDVTNLPSFLTKSKLLVDQYDLKLWAERLRPGTLWEAKSLTREGGVALAIPRLPGIRRVNPTLWSVT